MLEWIKIVDYKGGWVSEIFLAFASIVKWCYYPFTTISDTTNTKEIIHS